MSEPLVPSPGVVRLIEDYWETAGDDLLFAAKAGIDVRTWRRWKSGEISPSDAKLHEVRRRLDVFRLAESMLKPRGRQDDNKRDEGDDKSGQPVTVETKGQTLASYPVTPPVETPDGKQEDTLTTDDYAALMFYTMKGLPKKERRARYNQFRSLLEHAPPQLAAKESLSRKKR